MSWLFGIKNQAPPPQTGGDEGGDPNQPAPAPLSKSERKAMEAYRFDSSALERAAAAAKTLEKSSKQHSSELSFCGCLSKILSCFFQSMHEKH